jgi:hypothetical protein
VAAVVVLGVLTHQLVALEAAVVEEVLRHLMV